MHVWWNFKCVCPAASNVTFHIYQRETQTHVLREVVSQESPKVPSEEEGTGACCVPVPARSAAVTENGVDPSVQTDSL